MSAERRRGSVLLRLSRRIGGMVLVVWGAATAGFLAMRLIPGDPVDVLLGVNTSVSQSVRDGIRDDWGLLDPLPAQYVGFLGRLVTGQFDSYQLRRPVFEIIAQQTVPTLQLTALALLFALILAFSAALLGRGRVGSRLASTLELLVISAPTFWIGLLLLTVFAYGLGWFPSAASAGFAALVLPALTLALPVGGIISQVLRQGLDDAERQPFATTVRARGAGRARLLLRHTLRHAASDTLSLTGYLVGSLLGGAVLVETVFGRQGLGGVAVRAILGRDMPVVIGIIVLAAIVFVLLNLLVDLTAARLDPRRRAIA